MSWKHIVEAQQDANQLRAQLAAKDKVIAEMREELLRSRVHHRYVMDSKSQAVREIDAVLAKYTEKEGE